jgi:hypothetical protein
MAALQILAELEGAEVNKETGEVSWPERTEAKK